MKKGFLFSIVAMLLSGFWFGGVSLATTSISVNTTSVDFGTVVKWFTDAQSDAVLRPVIITNDWDTTVKLNTTSSHWNDWPFGIYWYDTTAEIAPGWTQEIRLRLAPSSSFASIIGNYSTNYVFSATNIEDDTNIDTVSVAATSQLVEPVAQVWENKYATLQAAISAASEGDTITLLNDVTLTNDVRISKNINLNMGWHTIDGNNAWAIIFSWATSEISNWTITSTDPTYAVLYIQYWANVTIKDWTYSNQNVPVIVLSNSTATINGWTFTSTKESWISVAGGWNVIINDATVNAQEAWVLVTNWSTATISGWTFTTVDNFVVWTNGRSDYAWSTITINWWEFNWNILTDWFIACWIYVANNDTVTVNWWTFNVPNWVWIVARGWITNVSKDVVFDVSSNESLVWKVWDSNIRVPNNKEVVIDLASGYPGSNEWDFKVTAENVTVVEWATPTQYDVKFAEWNNTLTVKKANDILVVDTVTAEEWYQWYNWDETSPYVFNAAITDNVTLTSRINQYTVSFDANAEWVTNPVSQEINHWEKATDPEIENAWNILLWWFNGEDKFDFETPVTSDLTLTAKWEAMISTWEAKIDDDTENWAWMVVEAEAPATPVTAASAVQSSNSTATVQWEVELDVYNDANWDWVKDDGAPISDRVNFTKAVLVRIPVNSWSSVKIKVKHNWVGQTFGIDWLATASGDCNNWVASSNVYDGSARSVNSWYAEIWTCSASTFVAYTEVTNPTSSSNTSWWWGGWGGSSSSYSCKSLPANAVVNNTSKPKKDTNYSYSTDTGVVCTFQCKTGYTRNEKDEKCEKSSETLTDTDKEGAEKVDTTDTSDTAFEDLRKVLDDGYNVEFHNAYNFAFKNGITTMPNIQAADMNSPLTRIAMAKMLSQYAINVLKKTPDTTKTISFPDVSAELDAEYNNGVTLAYQLWIMWVNIENFRPDDLVTRAEFVTALSRMLFGLADGENLYYETHMQKLLDENIITVDNPNMHELRGYVMIMLMRSVKNN